MIDTEFLAALERCELPAEAFGHEAHVRAGYLYLRAHGFSDAVGRMAAAIRRYAAHLGHPEKYNETVTVACMALIAQHMAERGNGDGWTDFRRRNPELFAPDLLAPYYETSELQSELARRTFILPRRSGTIAGVSARADRGDSPRASS